MASPGVRECRIHSVAIEAVEGNTPVSLRTKIGGVDLREECEGCPICRAALVYHRTGEPEAWNRLKGEVQGHRA
jgi:hypothetical protein